MTEPTTPPNDPPDGSETTNEWAARKALGWLISAAVVVVPIVVAVGAATLIVHQIAEPSGLVGQVLWWVAILVLPWLLYLGASRVARRALPLAALLRMTLVFPDRAPSRMAVARKAGSTRALERQLQAGAAGEAAAAAEQILALAASLNRHDRLTRGHSERVRVLTDFVADELKLPADDRNRLRWAALLHDIGKMSVPGSILNKPKGLDADEFELMKRHPEEGARLTAPLAEWLGPWAATVPQHHERYDGTGYPLGLAGDQISLGGRIVAVTDSYEVMTAVRSYKRAMSAEDARNELARCAGTHFDPLVVRAFLEGSVGRVGTLGGPLAVLIDLLANAGWRLGSVAGGAGNVVAGVAGAAGVGAAAVGGAHHIPPAPTNAAPPVVRIVPQAQATPLSPPPPRRPPPPFHSNRRRLRSPRRTRRPLLPAAPRPLGRDGARHPLRPRSPCRRARPPRSPSRPRPPPRRPRQRCRRRRGRPARPPCSRWWRGTARSP